MWYKIVTKKTADRIQTVTQDPQGGPHAPTLGSAMNKKIPPLTIPSPP